MEMNKCTMCDEIITETTDICDFCYYTMRLNPIEWKKELERRGINVEERILKVCNDIHSEPHT